MTPICPYCSAEIEAQGASRICEVCGTAHHPECWEENGGCTVFGCIAAPAEEPKITVSADEFVSAAPPPPPIPGSSAPPPPPPPPGVAAGQPFTFAGYAPAAAIPQVRIAARNRMTYVLLGVFLGALGVHNFYAGYTGRGGAQLAVSVLSLGYGALISWIWAIVEICTVSRDRSGNLML